MAPHKAAKKAAKKSAKKAAKHHGHHHGHDLRRAYEHMGRLEALGPRLDEASAADIRTLLTAAHASLAAEDAKSAADLLRAGEHLAFATLASTAPDNSATQPLVDALEAEYEHLLRKADEHWAGAEQPDVLAAIYAKATREAETALRQGAFRRALEFLRAAEALAHVKAGRLLLDDGSPAGKELLE